LNSIINFRKVTFIVILVFSPFQLFDFLLNLSEFFLSVRCRPSEANALSDQNKMRDISLKWLLFFFYSPCHTWYFDTQFFDIAIKIISITRHFLATGFNEQRLKNLTSRFFKSLTWPMGSCSLLLQGNESFYPNIVCQNMWSDKGLIVN